MRLFAGTIPLSFKRLQMSTLYRARLSEGLNTNNPYADKQTIMQKTNYAIKYESSEKKQTRYSAVTLKTDQLC